MGLLDRVYERSPIAIQNAMATAYGMQQWLVRHRGAYEPLVRQLDAAQWLGTAELQAIQDARVRDTIAYAATEIPYYRELFAREGIRPAHIQRAADLRILPFLDKATVQREGHRLRPDRRKVRALAQTTGGTTGRPVPYFVTPATVQFNYATYEARFRRWAGVAFGDSMVSINGKPIVPMRQAGPPYWRHNLAFNQLYVSAYHLSDANLPAILARMAAFAPKVIVAYVSAVLRVARFANAHGLAGTIRPRAVLVSSETLFDHQRAEIEQAFGCQVYNAYSLGEPVCFVSQCERGGMHVSPEYGVFELVDHGDGQHEVVATGLINDAMPLLRYRTGDIALPHDSAPCSCGRGLPTTGAILGRVDEMVVTPEGSTVGPAALSLAFQSVSNLREAQIVQRDPSAIELALAVTPAYGPADEKFLLGELRKRLGHALRIDLTYVDSVGKTVSGKQRLVISKR